jgi:hypothetical protein
MEMKGAAYAQMIRDRDTGDEAPDIEHDAGQDGSADAEQPAEHAQATAPLDPADGGCTITTMERSASLERTLVIGRASDRRRAMKAARVWVQLVQTGLVADPTDPALRMLSVSAFVLAATATAPDHLRVRPALGHQGG